MRASSIHDSPYSGTWYPDDPPELAELLDSVWAGSEKRSRGPLLPGGLAFVVPHAGLAYSGQVAAAVYRHLERQQPKRVLLAGFSHRGSKPGIHIPEIEGYSTPLGRVPVDRELADALAASEPFHAAPEASLCDHSIEIQLPLLQRAVPEARIVPLYVSSLDSEARDKAARRLAELVSAETILLASSDLTHFGRGFRFQPFDVDEMVRDRLRQLDYEIMEAAGSLDARFFLETLRETSATVCGYEPIALLLATIGHMAAREEFFQQILDYQTSGELTGDFHSSVSYGALGYFPYSSFELNPEEQSAVIALARQALAQYQRTGTAVIPQLPPSGQAALARHAALFVTLHKSGELRGCLGRTEALQSIENSLAELTVAAASEDTRFSPVGSSETGLDLEVSILSPMRRVINRAAFRACLHGALLKAKGRIGLLLPQVARERNWDADRFLQALATKAGVRPDVLTEPGTRLYIFRAQIIR